MICVCLILCGCKKEEATTGDIKYKKDTESLVDSISYEINNKHHIDIRSEYEGTTNIDNLFAYMINDENGMFIVEYVDILNTELDKKIMNEYNDVDKNYYYVLGEDVLDIYYYIDDEYYVYISIENLNSEFDEDNINYLFNQLDFDVYEL